MGHVVSFTHLETLAADLEAAGVRQASTVPEVLNLPGVWLQVDPVAGIVLDHLDGYTLNVIAWAVVPERDHRRAMADLADLVNIITGVVDPSGPITPAALALPQHPQPMPALAVPVALAVE